MIGNLLPTLPPGLTVPSTAVVIIVVGTVITALVRACSTARARRVLIRTIAESAKKALGSGGSAAEADAIRVHRLKVFEMLLDAYVQVETRPRGRPWGVRLLGVRGCPAEPRMDDDAAR
jgi:hypothetical protein